MSRAFVKEMDDERPAPPLERPVSAAPNFVTPRGARLIEAAIADLEAQLAAAPAEDAIAVLRRDLRYWTARHASMRIKPSDAEPEVVAFGVRARISRGGQASDVTIVGEDEADPAAGLIAWTSPLARALEEAAAGDTVELEAGGRLEPIEVLKVGPAA